MSEKSPRNVQNTYLDQANQFYKLLCEKEQTIQSHGSPDLERSVSVCSRYEVIRALLIIAEKKRRNEETDKKLFLELIRELTEDDSKEAQEIYEYEINWGKSLLEESPENIEAACRLKLKECKEEQIGIEERLRKMKIN